MSENRSKLGRAPQRIVIVLLPQNSIIRVLVVVATVSFTRIVGKVARYDSLNSVSCIIIGESVIILCIIIFSLFVSLVFPLSIFLHFFCKIRGCHGLKVHIPFFRLAKPCNRVGWGNIKARETFSSNFDHHTSYSDCGFSSCDITSIRSPSFPSNSLLINHSCHLTVPCCKA